MQDVKQLSRLGGNEPQRVIIHYPWKIVSLPPYSPGLFKRWKVEQTPSRMLPAYFIPFEQDAPGIGLFRKDRGKWGRDPISIMGNIQKQAYMPHVAAAHGEVWVFGCKMGLYLYNILQKEDVTRVVVFEDDEETAEIFFNLSGWKSWPNSEKLSVEWNSDILTDLDYLVSTIGTAPDYAFFDQEESNTIHPTHGQWYYIKEYIHHFNPKMVSWYRQEWDIGQYMIQNIQDVILTDILTYDHYFEYIKSSGLPFAPQGMEYPKWCLTSYLIQQARILRAYDKRAAGEVDKQVLRLLGVIPTVNPGASKTQLLPPQEMLH